MSYVCGIYTVKTELNKLIHVTYAYANVYIYIVIIDNQTQNIIKFY